MERIASPVRPDWERKMEDIGFEFHSADGGYWEESVCYRFTAEQIDVVEEATAELHRLAKAAAGFVIANDRWDELRIPRQYAPYVRQSWERGERSLFGRFDLAWDGQSPPKLLEYNADTPTSLVESAIAQWQWWRDLHPGDDQFNSLHERLIERWKLVAEQLPPGCPIHFACLKDNEEDWVNLEYVRDTALQAGIDARFIYIEDIGVDGNGQFVNLDMIPIRALFKLYPWEWMVREAFGPKLLSGAMRLIEPPWKMILSNKGILPILWELFPDHPNLLPAYFAPDRIAGDFVKKPVFSREGANVEMHRGGVVTTEPGRYGEEGWIWQACADLPCFDGKYPVIGSWVVGDDPAGMCVREDVKPVTTNLSRFVPHYFI